MLLEILERVVNLKSFELSNPFSTLESLGDSHGEGVAEAIVKFPSVQNLALGAGFPSTRTVIRTMHSRPRKLSISLYWDGPICTVDDLDELLSNLAPTLEVLDMVSSLDCHVSHHSVPVMRSVKLSRCTDAAAFHDAFLHTFPVLDGTLKIGHIDDDLVHQPEQRWHLRAQNCNKQQDKAWASLDRVIGSVLALHVSGLMCSVRHLMIEDVCQDYKDEIVAILRDISPTHLQLSITSSHGTLPVLDSGLFLHEGVPRLTHLVLRFYYHNLDDGRGDTALNTTWDSCIPMLTSSLCPLHLTHLRLSVEYAIDLVDDAEPYSRNSVRSVRHLDHSATATMLAVAHPSLQHVFIMSGGSFNAEVVPPG
ncbi:hypothetical protein BD413DRAFT_215022 [Trametes elegans]|nr:hypothetical protein BD413DRAFT_215022 [Trametes elegans]